MQNRKAIIEKINKLLALSVQGDQGEASAAMAAAKKLMQSYLVTDDELHVAEVIEVYIPVPGRKTDARIPEWYIYISKKIAQSYSCATYYRYFDKGMGATAKSDPFEFVYLGVDPYVHIAATVLKFCIRQGNIARQQKAKELQGYRKGHKTFLLNSFVLGWAFGVASNNLNPIKSPQDINQVADDKALILVDKVELALQMKNIPTEEFKHQKRDSSLAYEGYKEGQKVIVRDGLEKDEELQIGLLQSENLNP